MDKPKILSGHELVAKGITKYDATLPEVGMKDVTPNGSWLEQKQIQSALEARKNLIEVERIEKHGTLSHAEWRDDLKLAEVTKQSGGYWQYMGHCIEKKIFLYPEEALYLMEVNCLQLKHHEVPVSLQKAYSLLLRDKICIVEYKVYAYLSRLGYKVFRHNIKRIKNDDKQSVPVEDITHEEVGNSSHEDENLKVDCIIDKESKASETVNSKITIEANHAENNETKQMKSDETLNISKTEDINVSNHAENKETKQMESDETVNIPKTEDINVDVSNHAENKETKQMESDETVDIPKTENINVDMSETDKNKNFEDSEIFTQENQVGSYETQCDMEIDSPKTINNIDMGDDITIAESSMSKKRTNEVIDDTEQNVKRIKTNDNFSSKNSKLDRVKKRQTMSCDSKSLHNFFKIIPDLFNKDTVTVTVPNELYIPKNVFTNKLSYDLNLANIRAKIGGRRSTNLPNYSMNDEVNTMNVRRIRSSSMNTTENITTPPPRLNRLPKYTPQYRPFQFWKAHCSVGSFQYNIFYQRPFLANCYVNQSRMHPMIFRPNLNPNNMYMNQSAQHGKRTIRTGDNMQRYHLECLKNLANRLKNLVVAGNTQIQNTQSLQRLLDTYNRRYRTRLRLTDQFNLEDDNIIETIELEDDDEIKKQRPNLEDISKKQILNKLKQLSLKLKKLEATGKAVAPHRRAFSNVVKHYNRRYNADIHLNKDYEIIDRKQVTVDSSSDSDCVIEEQPVAPKLYRNPFNVLRERLVGENNFDHTTEETQYEELKKVFENWLPDANEFGRPELVRNHHMKTRLMEYYRDQYLFDFLQKQQQSYENWLEAKISFLTHMDDTTEPYKNDPSTAMENGTADNSGIRPILRPEDCTDMPSMLKKLRIINTHKDDNRETSLTIIFDVYNRDVQNFKKSNPPKPHFRIVCQKESSSFPNVEEISALHKKYDDNVTIVFAIVSSSSISLLQINNFEIPVYVSSNEFA